MLATVRQLGFRFTSVQEEDKFIQERCQIQKTERNGKSIIKLYIDRVAVGEYQI
jgi:hypothetical protein